MPNPIVSIVIPTYVASAKIVEIPLKSISRQTIPKGQYEVILADNKSKNSKKIKELAEKYGAKIVDIIGKPSQACTQVNKGVKNAKGEYILILDHDISLDSNLLKNFLERVKMQPDIDAWYIPYKIISHGVFFTKVRNFEEQFYNDSIIAAPRMIKRDVFLNTEYMYDPKLNAGPADWDLTIQLKRMRVKFDYLKKYFSHHEEEMNFWQYLTKKTIYAKGGEIYKNKWKKKDPVIFATIVKKQYDPIYRLFGIFIEDGKWKKLLPNLHLYVCFLLVKVLTALFYSITSFER